MALILYLTKVPKFKSPKTDTYVTIPIKKLELIDKYLTWRRVKLNGGNAGNTFMEWCGVPMSELPDIFVVKYYTQHFTLKTFYDEYAGETEGYTIFEELGRIVKANHIFRWFIENVMDGKPDGAPHQISKNHLTELLIACLKVRKGFKFIDHDDYFGDQYSVDEKLAMKYLPLMDEKDQGYFFGAKTYNETYSYHVNQMIQIIEEILSTTNFEQETVYLTASW